jgi:hypothetical protein
MAIHAGCAFDVMRAAQPVGPGLVIVANQAYRVFFLGWSVLAEIHRGRHTTATSLSFRMGSSRAMTGFAVMFAIGHWKDRTGRRIHPGQGEMMCRLFSFELLVTGYTQFCAPGIVAWQCRFFVPGSQCLEGHNKTQQHHGDGCEVPAQAEVKHISLHAGIFGL